MDKEILKKAFEAGRDYQYSINPYSGKPDNDKALSFTKWHNKLVKKLTLQGVSQLRELLKAYEMFVNKDAYNKLEDPINKIIEKFLAFNCGNFTRI